MKENKKRNIVLCIIASVLAIVVVIQSIWIVQNWIITNGRDKEQWDFAVDKDIEENFEPALSDGRIEVWFQPIADSETGETVGAEGLSRWRDGDGFISPSVFVPTLEATGQIKELDFNVFNEACRFQKKRLEEGNDLFPISVNLSVQSVMSSDIVSEYVEAYEEYGLPDGCINIEVTESIDGDVETVSDLVKEFHHAGFLVEIDDFGAGYAAYSNLVTIFYDILKLDKSLIDGIGTERGDNLVTSIIQMANSLGMKTIAEGAETKEQVEFLYGAGCDAIQGYYYSKPLPQDEFIEYITQTSHLKK